MSDIKKKLDFLVTSHKKLTGSDLNYEIATSYIDLFKRIKNKKTLMISGSQGSGKSTMSLQIKKYFKKYYSKNVVILSLDDFYLSSHQRKLLAKRHNTNLFETRGVPGTHNLKLLNQTIRYLKSNKFPLFLPVFDKVSDNRKKYRRKVNKADLIILEGWCVGSKPIDPNYLKKNINDLEKIGDSKLLWRTAYNNALVEYQKLFNKFSCYIFIKIPSWDFVIDWKYKQELGLRSSHTNIHLKKKLLTFIQYYEKLSKWMSLTSPSYCNVLITLDKNQTAKKITYK